MPSTKKSRRPARRERRAKKRPRMTEQRARAVKNAIALGKLNYAQIARKYDLLYMTVHRIANGFTYVGVEV